MSIKAGHLAPRHEDMLHSRKSLASYFDERQDNSWYDQTEGGLGALAQDGTHSHDIPEFGLSEDEDDEMEGGLGTEFLGSWMWHPKHAKEVWVPDGVHSVFDKPKEFKFQEKGQTQWAENAWGYEDYERRHMQSKQAKGTAKKETKEERTERRKGMTDQLKKAREKAYVIALASDLVPENIKVILRTIEVRKQKATSDKNEFLLTQKGKGMKGKALNMELHALKTNVLRPGDQILGYLREMDAYCKEQGFDNIVGDKVYSDPDGTAYLLVALSFLSQMKKQIMTCLLATARKAIKAGDKTEVLYNFVNYSYLANDLRKRLTKDKYPKKLKKDFADTEMLTEWSKHVRTLERESFKKRHPKAKIPKRLKDKRGPGKKKGKKGKKGRGGAGGQDIVIDMGGGKKIHIKPGNGGGKNKQNKQKHAHHKPKEHTFRHAREEVEDDDTYVPPPPAGRRPYYAPDPMEPAHVAPDWRRAQPASRMQRGYW
jgi:hypothetical protein